MGGIPRVAPGPAFPDDPPGEIRADPDPASPSDSRSGIRVGPDQLPARGSRPAGSRRPATPPRWDIGAKKVGYGAINWDPYPRLKAEIFTPAMMWLQQLVRDLESSI